VTRILSRRPTGRYGAFFSQRSYRHSSWYFLYNSYRCLHLSSKKCKSWCVIIDLDLWMACFPKIRSTQCEPLGERSSSTSSTKKKVNIPNGDEKTVSKHVVADATMTSSISLLTLFYYLPLYLSTKTPTCAGVFKQRKGVYIQNPPVLVQPKDIYVLYWASPGTV
jgi:hypothetical protein